MTALQLNAIKCQTTLIDKIQQAFGFKETLRSTFTLERLITVSLKGDKTESGRAESTSSCRLRNKHELALKNFVNS
jgi:hypothetical protein